MAAVVGAEAFKTGMETGLIPNSHVAPGTPPQPHSTANVAAKPSNCAALGMARARPIAFLRHLDNVAAHTCRRRSRRRLREDGRVQCHPQRPSSLLSFNYVASWVARARRRRRQRRGRPYSGCFGTSYPHRDATPSWTDCVPQQLPPSSITLHPAECSASHPSTAGSCHAPSPRCKCP